MKKLFFYAVAAAGLLTACSSNDDVVATGTGGENPDSPQAIKIGVSSVAAQVGTRGTGTVGGVYNGEEVITPNNWAGQKVNVYMFEKNSLTLATDGTNPLYKNAVLTTPTTGSTGEADYHNPNDDSETLYKYYPPTGTFDFWGYRLDGAEQTNKVVESENAYTIDFTIEGSQDVMRAKATNNEVKDANGTVVETVSDDIVYSAKAARKGLHPDLEFEHLLTRFTFNIIGGTPDACPITKNDGSIDGTSAVKIESIELTSKTNGTLTIAHTGDVENYITWKHNENETATDGSTTGVNLSKGKDEDGNTIAEFYPYLKLQQRSLKEVEKEEAWNETDEKPNEGYTYTSKTDDEGTTVIKYYKLDEFDENAPLEDFSGAIPDVCEYGKTSSNPKSIGEALLVSPNESLHKLRIRVSQKVLKHAVEDPATATEDDYEIKKNTMELDLLAENVMLNETTNADLKVFAPATSYNVNITVFSFERVKVNTTLKPWQDGGFISISGE